MSEMKTFIVENDPRNAEVYQSAGIDRIFIDLEIIGKNERQGHLDTVISQHQISDIKAVKAVLTSSELLARVNPINPNSEDEINEAIKAGCDIIMLPMFKTKSEVELFIGIVDRRVKTSLLLETSEALARLDDVLSVQGIDEIHIGLNDLHLALGLDFMFEIMCGSLLEYIVGKIKAKNIPFGIGGVARMDDGVLPGKVILKEHARLGSTRVILSRTFKGKGGLNLVTLKVEINKIHSEYIKAKQMPLSELKNNKLILVNTVRKIISQ